MKRLLSILTLAVLVMGASVATDPAVDDASWEVDSAHSAITFKVRHFFTPVNGRFNDYEIDLTFDPENLEESSISAVIQVASIDTENERRNNHLKSGDFFNAEEFPTITFESSSIESTGENEYVANGTLTIRDNSMDFALPFTLLGVMDVPEDQQERMGKRLAGFQAEASLNRNDFGVGTGSWTATAVVGDRVDFSIQIEAKQR